MPSFQDSAVIFFLALLLFGPKKLPELARQLGKLMGEFRRASAEFRMQMDEELRISEQAERQKQIAAIEAAAPVPPELESSAPIGEPEHPHLPAAETAADEGPGTAAEAAAEGSSESAAEESPLPIATSGDLSLMPPATGLPVARASSATSSASLFGNIPAAPDPAAPEPLMLHLPESTAFSDEVAAPQANTIHTPEPVETSSHG